MLIKIRVYKIIIGLTLFLLLTTPSGSECSTLTHWITGKVLDAADGIPADGAIVTVYKQTNSDQKLYDVVGVNGNSATLNRYQVNVGDGGFSQWCTGDVVVIEVKKGTYAANATIILTEVDDEVPDMTIVAHPCDINHDGIIFHDYNDLMTAYKCFLGIGNCNNKYQNWTSMKEEYDCFIGNYR